MNNFIHLRAHSDYSLGKSMAKISDLADFCLNHNMPAIGIADRGNLFGALEFSNECLKRGIKPLIGCVIKVDYAADENKWNSRSINSKAAEYGELLLIAKNSEGYSNLLKLVSKSFLDYSENFVAHVKYPDVLKYSKGIVLLCGGQNSPVSILHSKGMQDEAQGYLKDLQKHFKNDMFIELMRFSDHRTNRLENFLLSQAYELNLPIVATNPISFLKRESYEAQDALTCIAGSTYLLEENREKAELEHYFKTKEEMLKLFSDLPEALDNTMLIASKCSIVPENRSPMLPKFSSQITDEEAELKSQVEEGLRKRIEHIKDEEIRKKYFDRLYFELEIINKMKFPGYFLIVSDFVKWSKEKEIPVGPGRGSGVGSIVAWSLEITNLDPIHFGLLFERFLNPERVSMPDFDIDFCQERRDEVIEYVRNKYGSELVAQIITFGKLQARAVLRDVGRVLQMPYSLVDKISKMVPHNPANPITLGEAIKIDKEMQSMRDNDSDVKKLLSVSLELEGICRHVSTHAAGIIIGDRPLVELVPMYKDSNSTMQVIQFSLKYAEASGLMKFDFLGLKTLSVISRTIKSIKENRNIELDFSKISLEDKSTYKMLSCGNTIGVFQFEGAGMKEAIKQLKPDKIEDLIALSSLYRPGPMDNIPSYINRKHGREEVSYIHPLLQDTLKETYGIIIYQEQVMKIAQILAGYSLGEADILRRAMGKKNREEMEKQKEVFINRSVENSVKRERADEIFTFVEKFASYGFNKSHAAAYSVISFQTAYLKAHYPQEFLVSSINLEINDSNKIGLFCRDAAKFNISILPPDINKSLPYFGIEGDDIRFGLSGVKNVGVKATESICEERQKNGKFSDIFNFVTRCSGSINKRLLENLAKSGVLDSIHENRHEILKNVELLIKHGSHTLEAVESTKQLSLIDFNAKDSATASELVKTDKFTEKEKLEAEFEALGMYLSSHPLDSYEKLLKKLGAVKAKSVEGFSSESSVKKKIAGVIISKKIRSSKRGKYAFLQLSDQTSMLDISIFNENLLYKHGDIIQEGKLVLCDIDVKKDKNGLRITVDRIDDFYNMMKGSISGYNIYIKSSEAAPIVRKSLSDDGFKINLYAVLPNGTVLSFASKSPLYMKEEGINSLKSIQSLEIIEY